MVSAQHSRGEASEPPRPGGPASAKPQGAGRTVSPALRMGAGGAETHLLLQPPPPRVWNHLLWSQPQPPPGTPGHPSTLSPWGSALPGEAPTSMRGTGWRAVLWVQLWGMPGRGQSSPKSAEPRARLQLRPEQEQGGGGMGGRHAGVTLRSGSPSHLAGLGKAGGGRGAEQQRAVRIFQTRNYPGSRGAQEKQPGWYFKT